MVAGGAGYIGSHCLRFLLEQGHDAFAFDNLSTGHRGAVLGADLVEGCLSDRSLVRRTLVEREVEAVFHFAASALVGESMSDPAAYYDNNVVTTYALLEAMREAQTPSFVFSSTCAIYGEPVSARISESHPKNPISTYGWTKLVTERMLADYERAYGLRWMALRYFNAAGAHPSGDIGEAHQRETHLIPIILQVALGQRTELKVFGDDYPTPDGSCIRDYIHILDLASAHLLALQHLVKGGKSQGINLGNGEGYSVIEMIRMVEEVIGREIPFSIADRRSGDPARLIGDATRAAEVLGWTPRYGLHSIIETAWRWHQSHPHGFAT
jgi:UDP-glucose-4-epimerase GalE